MDGDDLDRAERGVVGAVAGQWEREVAAFRRALLALWSANGQHVTAAQVRALASRLDTKPAVVDAARLLTPAAKIGDARVTAKTKVMKPGAATVGIITKAQKGPASAVAIVSKRALALNLDTLSGVLGVIGPLSSSVNNLRGATSFAVHRAASEAAASAAEEAGRKLVFVAERDACLDCTDHAGDTGDALELPPLHPFCRCEVQEYDDPAVPAALKREAVRSVLRGFSLPSESEAARLRAAKAMLSKGPKAPESVKRYARTALSKGGFPRGRGVPGSR